jgi:hypothetical protein
VVDGVVVEQMDGCPEQVPIGLAVGTHTITARVRTTNGDQMESTTTYEVRK